MFYFCWIFLFPPCTEMESLKYPSAEAIRRTHKKKRLIPTPNSLFYDVKCATCGDKTSIFSHSQTVVFCKKCQTVIAKPTGGKAKITAKCKIRAKPAY